MCSGLSIREEISKLYLRRHIMRGHSLFLHSMTHVEGINTYVFGELVLHRVTRNADGTSTVR
jgi:hypothetical protein